MAFDYKKEYKEFYLPKKKPEIVTVPKMNYIAVKGCGDPNKEDGEYKNSISILYALAFTIKMSKLIDYRIEGYFDYVVPPLEGDQTWIKILSEQPKNWYSYTDLDPNA